MTMPDITFDADACSSGRLGAAWAWCAANAPRLHEEDWQRGLTEYKRQLQCQRSALWRARHPEEAHDVRRRRRAQRLGAGGTHTVGDIRQLFEVQHGECQYCGQVLSQGWHVDHVVPLCRGGSDNVDNLALTCPRCNMKKGRKLLGELHGCLSARGVQ